MLPSYARIRSIARVDERRQHSDAWHDSVAIWWHAGHYILGSVTVADGNMEAANTTAWSATGCAIQKQDSPKHSGARSLEGEKSSTGVASVTHASAPLTVGVTYVLSAWIRCNSSTMVPTVLNGATTIWTGVTAPNVWQHVSVEFVAGDTNLIYKITGGNSGTKFYLDDITITGNAVSSLVDQSGNGRSAIQAITARQPVYSVVGGLPRVTFSLANASEIRYSGNIGATGTVFIAMKADAANDGVNRIHFGDGNVGWLVYSQWVGGQGRWTVYNGAAIQPAFDQTKVSVFEFCFNGADSYYAVNGGTKTTGNTGGNTPAHIAIGYPNASNAFSGYFHEVIMFAGTVSDSVRHSVVNHLKDAWNIT